jgi:hypothetical protein
MDGEGVGDGGALAGAEAVDVWGWRGLGDGVLAERVGVLVEDGIVSSRGCVGVPSPSCSWAVRAQPNRIKAHRMDKVSLIRFGIIEGS